MKMIKVQNRTAFSKREIPRLSYSSLCEEIREHVEHANGRLVCLFAIPEHRGSQEILLVATIVDEKVPGALLVAGSPVVCGGQESSLTPHLPAAHLFEREIWERFGVEFVGHPWLKPVRYPHDAWKMSSIEEYYPYLATTSEEMHEVAVGPVHAGVIEPGHFRFLCDGERVDHLEIQLGYQHRGVERLFCEGSLLNKQVLAESVAGDAAVAHATAYAGLVEALGSVVIPRRAAIIRAIGLELERSGIHLGDLAALCNDIGYLPGTQMFAVMRTDIINTSLALCGSRFGRGLVTPGGVQYDIDAEKYERISTIVSRIRDNAALLAESIFDNQSVLARFEKTGTIDAETARQIGLVGPAARASGLSCDVRISHPTDAYAFAPFTKAILRNGEGKAATSGDVYARAFIRHQEIQDSLRYIKELLPLLEHESPELAVRCPAPRPDMLALSLVESWRGETLHAVATDTEGNVYRYYIKDASFHNWFGLALAVRDNGVSDFPLCNKSFNLSYCGFDL